MSYATIEVKPVTPRLGAEISNIDLTTTLSNRQVEDLHTALAEHQVLFFRDQKLSLDQQKTLGRHFGELHIHPNTPGPEGHPEILPIHADGNSQAGGRGGLALRRVLRHRAAAGQHPLSAHRSAGRWRYDLRQPVRGL